jgi:DnaJ like chaperone protein
VKLSKKITHSPYFGFGIGFLPGLLVTQNLLAACVLGFLGAAIQVMFITKNRKDDGSPKGFLKKEQEHLKHILALAGLIIKANGKDTVQEIAFVEHQLRKNFSAEFVPIAMSHLRAELHKAASASQHTLELARYFDSSTKMQLLNFLVNICAADGLMRNAERNVLFEISTQLGCSSQTLEAIIGRYRFRTEPSGQKNNQQQAKPASPGILDNAYKLLKIPATSTNEEIKKAYKKLAVLHHPDKSAHLGENVQKNAAEKFKAIAGAYDLICKKRGIV